MSVEDIENTNCIQPNSDFFSKAKSNQVLTYCEKCEEVKNLVDLIIFLLNLLKFLRFKSMIITDCIPQEYIFPWRIKKQTLIEY